MSKTMNLEGAVKRLEEIAAQMGGELSIDDSIKLYAEAVKLLDFANGKLEAAKLKVEKLTAAKEEPDEQL
ncbi:exodeoxyribonuclease VII small subunit [Marasmitruncus massiliensis]|uniref:exodeoxyribonuclease VII small subunit n=1 Tax=Marasmitruncus massiliensis TaxID=1944642 RepID=UPI0015E06033|nr:exodeoxyribonuclease VII small subunit [Marasmitruncus massiliensis]